MRIGQRVWVKGSGDKSFDYLPVTLIEVCRKRGFLVVFEHGGGFWASKTEIYTEQRSNRKWAA